MAENQWESHLLVIVRQMQHNRNEKWNGLEAQIFDALLGCPVGSSDQWLILFYL